MCPAGCRPSYITAATSLFLFFVHLLSSVIRTRTAFILLERCHYHVGWTRSQSTTIGTDYPCRNTRSTLYPTWLPNMAHQDSNDFELLLIIRTRYDIQLFVIQAMIFRFKSGQNGKRRGNLCPVGCLIKHKTCFGSQNQLTWGVDALISPINHGFFIASRLVATDLRCV